MSPGAAAVYREPGRARTFSFWYNRAPMCGRISRHHAPWELSERFDAKQLSIKMEDLEPRYNTAPTETVPIVVLDREGERKLTGAKWGLVPRWAKDPSIGNRLINARAEGAAEKPAFKWALE